MSHLYRMAAIGEFHLAVCACVCVYVSVRAYDLHSDLKCFGWTVPFTANQSAKYQSNRSQDR